MNLKSHIITPCDICVIGEHSVVMKPYQNNIIYFGETDYHGDKRLFGQYQKDKVYHTLITGQTGTGKSSLLEAKILQEIHHNLASVVVFDPHGDLIQRIAEKFPSHRAKDLIIIDPSDERYGYGYNLLKKVSHEHKPLVISGIIEIFQRMYGSAWGFRLEHLLRQCLYLLVEQKNATIADIPRLLVDEEFRYTCRLKTNDKKIHDFWSKEFPKYRSNDLLPLLSKIGSFINHPAVERTIIKPRQNISLRHAIDNKKVILISLSKGKLGLDISTFIGSLLVTSLSLASYSRANLLQWERPYCSLYIDEFQNYTSSSLVAMFSELRKFNLGITVATQRLSSLRQDIRDAVLGNVGTIITFRVSLDEARVLAKYLYPIYSTQQLASLPNYMICLVMMINGVVSAPFHARTLPFMDIYHQKIWRK